MDGAHGGGGIPPPPPPPPLGPPPGRGGPVPNGPLPHPQQHGEADASGGEARPLGPRPAPIGGPQNNPPQGPQTMIGPQERPRHEEPDPREEERRREAALFDDVASNLAKCQQVIWVKAVDSLEAARRRLNDPAPPPSSSSEARRFVDGCMLPIVNILLEQNPHKIGGMERECVDKSLRCALLIAKEDLDRCAAGGPLDGRSNNVAAAGKTGEDEEGKEGKDDDGGPAASPTFPVLGAILARDKTFYRKPQRYGAAGDPQARTQLIAAFRRMRGFQSLGTYLAARAGTGAFPPVGVAREALWAAHELVPAATGSGGGGGGEGGGGEATDSQATKRAALRNEARSIADAVMRHLLLLDERALKKVDVKHVDECRRCLSKLHARLADASDASRADGLLPFFDWWRALASKLITSQSLPLKLFGWDNVGDIISESAKLAPPPRAFRVSGAGTPFANGRYEYDPRRVTRGGYAVPGVEPQYHLAVPRDAVDDCRRGTEGPPPDGKRRPSRP